jgi:hypothetical protein
MVLVWSIAPSLNLMNSVFFQYTAQTARKLSIKENTCRTIFRAYMKKVSMIEEQQESDFQEM